MPSPFLLPPDMQANRQLVRRTDNEQTFRAALHLSLRAGTAATFGPLRFLNCRGRCKPCNLLRLWLAPFASVTWPESTIECLIDTSKTALERAFDLARSGRFSSMTDIRTALAAEGYSTAQIDGPVLQRQLRGLMRDGKKDAAGDDAKP